MESIIKFLLGIGLSILFCLLFAFPTMWLWNWLMPAIFGLCRITIWQALGINLLAGFIFRSSAKVNIK